MVWMHRTRVPVHCNGHQEERAPSTARCEHEDRRIAGGLPIRLFDLRDVEAGRKGQSRDEKEKSVKDHHIAAFPGPQLKTEDPQGKSVYKEPQNKLCLSDCQSGQHCSTEALMSSCLQIRS